VTDARLSRARSLAAQLPACAVTLKPQPGGEAGDVTFGRARNLGQQPIRFAPDEFDGLTDDAVLARLREAWGL